MWLSEGYTTILKNNSPLNHSGLQQSRTPGAEPQEGIQETTIMAIAYCLLLTETIVL